VYARSHGLGIISTRLPFVWDYDLDENQLRRLLSGTLTIGRLDRNWAAVRLLEYAPYREIVRLMGFRELVSGWPEWRGHIRSESRKRALHFLAAWLERSSLVHPREVLRPGHP
jgi:hypothetical protein